MINAMLSIALLVMSYPLMAICIYDDNGAVIQCQSKQPSTEAQIRAELTRERNLVIKRIREKRVDGIAYFGFGSLDAFRNGLNQVAYEMTQQRSSFIEKEKQNCEGAKVVCEDFARFFAKIIPVLDESFVWTCGNWYQQCMDKIKAWESIFDEMSASLPRDRLIEKARESKGASSGGAGGGSSSAGGATGSHVGQSGAKGKENKKEQDNVLQFAE